jgi:hypothetical protein
MNKCLLIQNIKLQNEEKVAVSLKIPLTLKIALSDICEKESISINSFIVAILKDYVLEDF